MAAACPFPLDRNLGICSGLYGKKEIGNMSRIKGVGFGAIWNRFGSELVGIPFTSFLILGLIKGEGYHAIDFLLPTFTAPSPILHWVRLGSDIMALAGALSLSDRDRILPLLEYGTIEEDKTMDEMSLLSAKQPLRNSILTLEK